MGHIFVVTNMSINKIRSNAHMLTQPDCRLELLHMMLASELKQYLAKI